MTIALDVAPETAKAFEAKTQEEQRRIAFMLGLRLHQLTSDDRRTLTEVMDDMGAYAAAQGMTPQLLESILNEE